MEYHKALSLMQAQKNGVVLLHGIFRTHHSMAGMAKFLERQGFSVLNLSYPSTRHDLETLADIIHPSIEQFAIGLEEKIHFVGYSMGGLLIRTYLHKFRPPKLGRVVMVGTPNSGSEVADFIRGWPLYKKVYGPAGQQLITDQSAFQHLFGEIDYELAVIAGSRSIDPVSSYIIGKPNDGKVSIDSTRLNGMKGHKVLPASHTFFPSNRRMWNAALGFLQTGDL